MLSHRSRNLLCVMLLPCLLATAGCAGESANGITDGDDAPAGEQEGTPPVDTGSGSGADSGSSTGGDSGTGADSGTGTDNGTDTGTGPDTDTGTDTGTDPDPEAPSAGVAPSGNFNLSIWKLTLPVSRTYYFGSGGDSAAEILPGTNEHSGILPLDQGFVDTDYFYTAADGSMAFKTLLSGGASTTNSSYVRSELRELYQWTPGSSTENANWPNEGSHTLQATVKVVEYYAADPQTVVGQIHAKDSSKALLKLQWDGPTAPVRAIINNDPSSGNPFSLSFGVVGTQPFTYTIRLVENTLSITVNGNTQTVTFGQNGMSSAWDDHVYYFKAGNYAQADRESGGLFEVHISALSVTHQ